MGTLLAITPQPSDGIVVITGMSLVFLILIVLSLIIMAQGKIFDSIMNKRATANAGKAKESAAQAQAAAPVPAPAPVVEEGIPQEVVAAIAAALASMGGGRYQLRALRKAQRSGWSQSGIQDHTQPF